ncbi:MAG TPA: CHAT domain-containing protein [Saprospiraceae bacterium]|nr:CHAT domain-containing protein [Saprospiraceae bacterium]
MDTLLFAFANQPAAPLPSLQEEDDTLTRLLAPRAKSQHFLLHRESFATVERLPSYLTLYRDSLALFLFSGHAGRDRLLLGDGAAHAAGLAQMLGQCPRLRLVVLNGCSTDGQVRDLLAAGVPVVVATSAPVDDRRATSFSSRFFEALQQQFTVREAFEMAQAALLTQYPDFKAEQHRSIGGFDTPPEAATWGLFTTEKTAHHLDWKLPLAAAAPAVAANFTPNLRLVEVLFKALSSHNDEIRKLYEQDQRKVQPVSLPTKRLKIINALPAPLAEPIRKLLVPIEQENEGYDKVSEARVRQIAAAYNTSMELLGFTMLAQLWEAFYQDDPPKIGEAQSQYLQFFFRLPKAEREVFDFLELIKTVKAVFDRNRIGYFVQELADLSRLIQEDVDFAESVQFLNGLRLQVRQYAPDASALAYLSQRGEECLAYLYSKLGFMARYRLATVQGIDVEKYRHRREPGYSHNTAILHDLQGGFALTPIHLAKPLDNRSILLVNEETWDYLNLSPFVVDENAFIPRTDVTKLFFFSHYLPAADTCCFKYVNKPDDEPLLVSAEHLPLVKEQMDAFAQLLFGRDLHAL